MKRYEEFEVVRTARLKCKRANDRNADDQGMRVYSYLKCPHCNVEVVVIPTASLQKQKYSAIKDHLRTCEVYKYNGGPVVPRRSAKSTVLVVTSQQMSEVEKLRAEMVEMKQEIKELQDKTCLYDSVLEAVMPSLALPLTAPEDAAKITLRAAAIKDITPPTLSLQVSTDMISKELHSAMIEHKNEMIEQKDVQIANEKERREELKEAHILALENYKNELEAKDSELSKTKREKERADQEKDEVDKRMHEVSKTVTSLSTRADRLQRERDAINAKYNAALKGHEQSVRNHGKHGLSPLSRSKIGMRGCATDAEAEEARAMDRAYAQVEREREAQKETLKRAQREGGKKARLE